MAILAKVTGDLEAPRGPDVVATIAVPPFWMGREVQFVLPRNAHCAACEGGGCDRCGRSGAIATREPGQDAAPARVALPSLEATTVDSALVLRIPELGGAASEVDLPRGHLLLKVIITESPDAHPAALTAHLVSPDLASDRLAERRELMKRSMVMAVVMIALFLGMLRLSGWL